MQPESLSLLCPWESLRGAMLGGCLGLEAISCMILMLECHNKTAEQGHLGSERRRQGRAVGEHCSPRERKCTGSRGAGLSVSEKEQQRDRGGWSRGSMRDPGIGGLKQPRANAHNTPETKGRAFKF